MRTVADILLEVASVPDFYDHEVGSVHYRSGYGDTPLHIVANWGDCEAIKLLVEAGAEIDARGESGFTPLHCAAEQNHAEAASLLLALGAKILENDHGETPLILAEAVGSEEVLKVFRNGS